MYLGVDLFSLIVLCTWMLFQSKKSCPSVLGTFPILFLFLYYFFLFLSGMPISQMLELKWFFLNAYFLFTVHFFQNFLLSGCFWESFLLIKGQSFLKKSSFVTAPPSFPFLNVAVMPGVVRTILQSWGNTKMKSSSKIQNK